MDDTFLALLAGGATIVLVMGRWHTRGGGSSDSSDPVHRSSDKSNTAQFDPALRERLERELKQRI